MYDICVIGAGPAGISSAVYAASRGLKTIVLEQKKVGGLLGSVSTVTHYAGILADETGESFSLRLKEQAERAGIEIAMEKVVEADLSGEENGRDRRKTYEAKAVIIAAGTTQESGIREKIHLRDVEQAESGKRCKEVRRQRSICCGRSRRSGERSAFSFEICF